MSRNRNGSVDRRSRKSGFTLIEMIVVVAIIVLLAGFLLPKLDTVMLAQNKGVAAGNTAGLNRYVQTYRIIHNVYPSGWDSLLSTTNTLVAPGAPGTTIGLDPQLVGGPPSASPNKLAVLELQAAFGNTVGGKIVRSLSRIGINQLYNCDVSLLGTLKPNDMFSVPKADAPTNPAGELTGAYSLATLNTGDDDALEIIRRIYKYPPSFSGANIATAYANEGSVLILAGFDRKNQAVGAILAEAPTYSNTSDPQQYYNRYLCVFKASKGGSRASLEAVLGADGDQLHEEIADYYEK